MPRPDANQKLLPSVLDRLIDLEPRVSSEAQEAGSQRVEQMKESVKRDLEWLLNSKRTATEPASDLPQLQESLLNYGLPDLSSLSFNSGKDRARLLTAIEDAIRRCEPRLSHVKVNLEQGHEFERALRFRIDAMLNLDPAPEPVTYDSVLQLNTKAFVVQGG